MDFFPLFLCRWIFTSVRSCLSYPFLLKKNLLMKWNSNNIFLWQLPKCSKNQKINSSANKFATMWSSSKFFGTASDCVSQTRRKRRCLYAKYRLLCQLLEAKRKRSRTTLLLSYILDWTKELFLQLVAQLPQVMSWLISSILPLTLQIWFSLLKLFEPSKKVLPNLKLNMSNKGTEL